jgi:hypothetical protein
MLSGDLATLLSDILQIKPSLVLDRAKILRAAGLLSKKGHGPRSGARMTDADATNSVLANVLERQRAENFASAVRRVRGLRPDEPLVELPAGFTHGLTFFDARNAGTALDSLLADLRTGRLATWAAGENYKLNVTIESRGASVFFSLRKPQRHELDFRSAVHGYAKPGFRDRSFSGVERNVTVHGDVFQKIAEALDQPRPAGNDLFAGSEPPD